MRKAGIILFRRSGHTGEFPTADGCLEPRHTGGSDAIARYFFNVKAPGPSRTWAMVAPRRKSAYSYPFLPAEMKKP
jgi:hypothetical protein